MENKINKKAIIFLTVIALLVVAGVGVVYVKTNKTDTTVDIAYENLTTVTAPVGEEYTTVDSDGNTYLVKSDGMYLLGEDGEYKLDYSEIIDKFNTYSYSYDNGTSVTFTLNQDGSYEYTTTYPYSGKMVCAGTFSLRPGINIVNEVLDIDSIDELSDTFMTNLTASNYNNLFYLDLKTDKVTYYDENGDEIVYEDELESYDEDDANIETNENANNSIERFVIYIYKDEDDLKCLGYSLTTTLLYTPWSTNGEMIVY